MAIGYEKGPCEYQAHSDLEQVLRAGTYSYLLWDPSGIIPLKPATTRLQHPLIVLQ
jgi:hypothetical protein